ncbi:unnamed protein product [Phytophthora fragariaefolia]|uniref:Unnamed protein product n=1 Tax=Phytophthora fragariaefolia TaxID=1490495 RepID=A0A9W6Y7I0_9STRA|nr:unnamed protein product [Phytophthora fragariaefolia]
MEDDQEHDEGCEPKNGTTHDSGVADAMASWLQQLQDRARLSPARASVGNEDRFSSDSTGWNARRTM